MSRFAVLGRRPRKAARLLVAMALAVTGFAAFRATASAGVSPGYWLVATDGGIFSYGGAAFFGSTGSIALNQPIVAMAPTPSGRGYWLVATDGGIFSYGDAGFFGSTGATKLNQPIVGMAPTPSGRGYWLVASDGGIFAYGDAGFFGSMGGQRLNKPVVDIASTPSGRGYWMVASDGGIFAFGDAGFFGSTGDINLAQRIHAMTPTRTGRGYWFVAGDGGVFAYGDAKFYGSIGGQRNDRRILDIAASPSGLGYYLVDTGGTVHHFGDAPFFGDTRDVSLNKRIASLAVVGGNAVPVTVDDVATVEEDGSVTIDVLANDSDIEGDRLRLVSVSPAQNGTPNVTSGGKVSYRPRPDFHGTDSFVYAVRDSVGEPVTARVSVTVTPVDDKPSAKDDLAGAKEGSQIVIPVLANDEGLGDGGIRVEVPSTQKDYTATVRGDNTILFTAKPGGKVTDPSFAYEVLDADGDRSTGKVTVALNRLPKANSDTLSANKGENKVIDFLSNDATGNGVQSVELIPSPGREPDFGLFALRGAAPNFTVLFRSDQSGEFSVGYRFTDVDGDPSKEATIVVKVVNRHPVPDNFETGGPGQFIPVLNGDSDPDGDPLSLVPDSGTTSGGGSFVCSFHPTTNEPGCAHDGAGVGPDSFEYQIEDGDGGSARGTVTITP